MARTKPTADQTVATNLRNSGASSTSWTPNAQPTDTPARYTREVFERDLEITSRRITASISNDPEEAARLRKSLASAKKGKTMPWRDSDDDDT